MYRFALTSNYTKLIQLHFNKDLRQTIPQTFVATLFSECNLNINTRRPEVVPSTLYNRSVSGKTYHSF